MQESPSPTSALPLRPNAQAPQLPPPSPRSCTEPSVALSSHGLCDTVSDSSEISSLDGSFFQLPPAVSNSPLPPLRLSFTGPVSDESKILKRLSPPFEPTPSPAESPCKCRNKYIAKAAGWMAKQLPKSFETRYMTQCERESMLLCLKVGSSEYADLGDCHRFDQPCCDPHITEVLKNCLCSKLLLKQRRASMIRACLQAQFQAGTHPPITNSLVVGGWWERHRKARKAISPLSPRPDCYSSRGADTATDISAAMSPPEDSYPWDRGAAKRLPAVRPQHTRPSWRTAQIREEDMPAFQLPEAESPGDPGISYRLTPTPQKAQHARLSKPCDMKPPSELIEPAVFRTSGWKDRVLLPTTPSALQQESSTLTSKRRKMDIQKIALGSKYDSPEGAPPPGIRDLSYNEEVSALAAGRAWSAPVAAQDTAGHCKPGLTL